MGKGAGWKSIERRVAKEIGGRRNGNRGVAMADAENSWLVCEVKHWSRSPQRVVNALQQAERAASDSQLPVAVIHPNGGHAADDLCVMRWGQFLDWFGDAC